MLQRDSSDSGNGTKKVKHVSIVIGCWDMMTKYDDDHGHDHDHHHKLTYNHHNDNS